MSTTPRPCHRRARLASGLALALATIAPVAAQEVIAPPPPAPAPMPAVAPPGPDGRYFGHLPYPEISAALLTTLADDDGRSCTVHRDAAGDLTRLIAAARAEGLKLRLLSCFRGIAHQATIFCGAGLFGACRDPADRARSVAPGGYSEHATGYVVDFGTDGPAGCNDLWPCMSGTRGGLWLARNAPRFGFEQSFPPANKQGVTWEPWHWRWVGVQPGAFGARAARTIFARARRTYPAIPAVADPAPVKLRPVDPNRFTGPRA